MKVPRPRTVGNYPDRQIDCEMALEPAFQSHRDELIASGMTDREAAEWLLAATDGRYHVHDKLAADAVAAGWTIVEARGAIASLARRNADQSGVAG